MSDPADKHFEHPTDKHLEFAPKTVRLANQQGNPAAAQVEFPRSVRFANQPGGQSAESEISRRHLRPSSESDAKLWRKSLDPEIMHSRPPSSFTSWNPWWPISITFAIALGAAIGVYFVDGTTWRKPFWFGTNTTEATSRLDSSKLPTQLSPAASLPIASATSQPANVAPPAGGVPVASPAHQPNAAQSAGPPIASAAPQPTNAAQAAAIVPTDTAAAQPTGTTPARVATAEGPRGSATAIRGVTDTEVRFGISAPFTGATKELGNQMRLGIETAFKLANDAGGIDGRQVKLVVADDGYEPTRTTDTMKQLFEKQQVFGFVGNVGTPTAVVALPYALQNHALFFGAFTGADLLRRDPPDRYVFNYRASYAEETDAVVRYLINVRKLRPDQIAVFAQHDAFGDAGFAGVEKAMRALRGDDRLSSMLPAPRAQTPSKRSDSISHVANGIDTTQWAILRLDYERNTVDVDNAVAGLRAHKTPIKAVVMVAAYRAAAKFIEKTRDLYPSMIYTNVSFVGSTALAGELMLLGPRYANGVIVTQVVPAVDGYSSAVLKYRNALAKYFPGEAPDYVSLEGYVDGTLLLEGLKRAGPKPDTEALVDALENLRNFDIGLGTPISFSQSDHQGSHKIWATQLDDHGHYQPVDLQ
jgi:branched-chain amino acid transport system substrate-binding protein